MGQVRWERVQGIILRAGIQKQVKDLVQTGEKYEELKGIY